MTPIDVHRSMAHTIDKSNGKSKIAGSRIVYCFCGFWGAWFRSGLRRGAESKPQVWLSYDHGFWDIADVRGQW